MAAKESIINISVTIITIFGGILFTFGSIIFLPRLYSYLNENAGGALFICGSVLYSVSDVLGAKIDPEFSPLKPWDNVGSLRALSGAISNIAYIVGSVYFLHDLPWTIGDNIFIAASTLLIIAQSLAIYGVTKKTAYTSKFYLKTEPTKNYQIATSLVLIVGNSFFIAGCIIFEI